MLKIPQVLFRHLLFSSLMIPIKFRKSVVRVPFLHRSKITALSALMLNILYIFFKIGVIKALITKSAVSTINIVKFHLSLICEIFSRCYDFVGSWPYRLEIINNHCHTIIFHFIVRSVHRPLVKFKSSVITKSAIKNKTAGWKKFLR